ncbi:MAG: YqeG family HAD IIIA-type phosphatase [Chthonomonadales bacterium]
MMRVLNLLCPGRYCSGGVTSIPPEELRKAGFRAVLLDVDNTLVGWQRTDIPHAVRKWIWDLKQQGLRICLVSNTRHPRRLEALAAELEVPFVRQALKPGRRGFLAALEQLGVAPSAAVMIGDQMFTDVLGGNRAGVATILVRPMHRREFVGTKVSRLAEGIVLAVLRRRGLLDEDGGGPAESAAGETAVF